MKTIRHLVLISLVILYFTAQVAAFPKVIPAEIIRSEKISGKEIKKTRQDILNLIRNNELTEAKYLADKLWTEQPKLRKCLLLKEYLLILFIVGDYDNIVQIAPKNTNYLSKSTSYPDMFRDLQTEARMRMGTIYSDIMSNDSDSDLQILRSTFYQLLAINDYKGSRNKKPKYDYHNMPDYNYENWQKTRNKNESRGGSSNNIGIKTELGTIYKYGFFSGDLNEIYSDFEIYKPFFIGLHSQQFYLDLGFSFLGVMGEMNKGVVHGFDIEGKFYSRVWDFYASVGWEVYSSKLLSITTTASFSYLEHKYYTREIKLFDKISNLNRQTDNYEGINGFGPGIFMDIGVWDFNSRNENHLAIRLRYDSFLLASDTRYHQKGVMHELSIGLLVIFVD